MEDQEFWPFIEDILANPAFQDLKNYAHHGPENSVYEHSLATARTAYAMGRRLGMEKEALCSLTRVALLHDFFGYDWHEDWYRSFVRRYHGLRRFTHMHAFVHGEIAALRAKLYFGLDDKQCGSIASHMFPLSTSLPKSREAWLVTLADKMVASKEMSVTAGRSVRKAYRRLRQTAFAGGSTLYIRK